MKLLREFKKKCTSFTIRLIYIVNIVKLVQCKKKGKSKRYTYWTIIKTIE